MNDDLNLDPSINADEVAAAHDAAPAPFPDVDAQDEFDGLMVRGLIAARPATPAQALINAKSLTDHDVFVGIGMCLATVRGKEFEVPALYPDAQTAWEESFGKHLEADPLKIPRGAVPYWVNDRHGHIAISVGGGLCRTTDYRRNGFVDLAPMVNLAPWCGGRLVGWAEGLNGVDVWPDARKKPTPPPWGLVEKRRLVANALKHARAKGGVHERRIDGLKKWLDHIDARIQEKK